MENVPSWLAVSIGKLEGKIDTVISNQIKTDEAIKAAHKRIDDQNEKIISNSRKLFKGMGIVGGVGVVVGMVFHWARARVGL